QDLNPEQPKKGRNRTSTLEKIERAFAFKINTHQNTIREPNLDTDPDNLPTTTTTTTSGVVVLRPQEKRKSKRGVLSLDEILKKETTTTNIFDLFQKLAYYSENERPEPIISKSKHLKKTPKLDSKNLKRLSFCSTVSSILMGLHEV